MGGSGHRHELVDDAAGAVGRRVGDQRVQLAVAVLAEAVHGQPVGQTGRPANCGSRNSLIVPVVEVGVEQPAVDARRRVAEREVAEDVLADQLGDRACRGRRSRR